jgi:hypothetical protein
LAVNAQHLRHLFLKLRVAAFQVVPHFVRLDLLLSEDLADRALDQLVKAGVALRWSKLTSVAGQKPGRPQLVGIPQVFRLPAGQRHQPGFGFGGDLRLLARPWTILESGERTVGQGSLNTPLNRLMMQSQISGDGKERRIFAVPQHIRARSTRFAGSVRDRAIDLSAAISASLIDNSITRRHA